MDNRPHPPGTGSSPDATWRPGDAGAQPPPSHLTGWGQAETPPHSGPPPTATSQPGTAWGRPEVASGWQPSTTPHHAGGWGVPHARAATAAGPVLAARGILIVTAVAFGIHALTTTALVRQQQAAGPFASGPSDGVVTLVGLTLVLVSLAVIATIVAFCIWQHRVHTSLAARGHPEARTRTPGFGVGSWFIPLWNLIVPTLVIRDLWRAAQRGRHVAESDGRVWAWWGLFVAVPVVLTAIPFLYGFVVGFVTGDPAAGNSTWLLGLRIPRSLSACIGAIVAAGIVARLTRWTDEATTATPQA